MLRKNPSPVNSTSNLAIPSPCQKGEGNLSKKVWQKLIRLAESFSRMRSGLIGSARRTPMMDEETLEERREAAPGRKVVQISAMVHPVKDWAFIALCDDGSMWLYHGSWSRIENIPETT